MDKKTKNGLIVTTLILGVGYFLYKKLRSSTPSNAEIDSQIGVNTGVNPSLSEDKMKELANKMFAAFNGFGTDVNGNNGLINLFAAIKNNDAVSYTHLTLPTSP
jgi:hypothetical protein